MPSFRARKATIKTQYFRTFLKNIIVPYEEFFGKEGEQYSEYVISIASKKAYLKMAELIVTENNIILNRNSDLASEFITKFYALKRAVDNSAYAGLDYKVFINDLVGSIFTVKFVEEIAKYVEENYITDIGDEVGEDKQKYKESITFLDRHYKILYAVSSMSRFVIPLCTHYVHMYPEVNTNKFLIDVFIAIFGIAQAQANTQMDVYAKLYEYVNNKVNKTLYPDQHMWSRMSFHGVTPKGTVEDTLHKLILNAIPKFSFDKNIMNLVTVVIRNTVTSYTLRKRDPYKIHCLSEVDSGMTDDDAFVAEADIFDSYNNRHDELSILLRKNYVEDTLEKICIRNNIIIYPEEIAFYHQNLKFHDFQKFTILQTFAPYFGGAENIFACNKSAYTRLVIIAMKMMDNLGISELTKYISGKRIMYQYKRMSKSFEASIFDDERYKSLVDVKYKNIKAVLERKNFIRDRILYLSNNTFSFNMLDNPVNGEVIEKDEEEIKNGVLNMFTRLIY